VLRFAGVVAALAVAIAVYAGFFGRFDVGVEEQAVVLRLGRYHRTVGPGRYRFYLPPFERFEKRAVTPTVDVEIGFRSVPGSDPPRYEDRPDEARMLTRDENLVLVSFAVRYRITDLRAWLFEIRDPDRAIRDAAAAAMRAAIAAHPIDEALGPGRSEIEDRTLSRLRRWLDDYGAGVELLSVQLQDVEPPEEVKPAFAEVTSAEQERARLELEAQGYAEKSVPEARGRGQEVQNLARAYREERIQRAHGESERFVALYEEYRKAPDVTRQRLYLETLEEVLPRVEKVVTEPGAADSVLPYLPLAPREARKGAEP
jgi:membrane protease subunit HflK